MSRSGSAVTKISKILTQFTVFGNNSFHFPKTVNFVVSTFQAIEVGTVKKWKLF
jgi:hypothetical protein